LCTIDDDVCRNGFITFSPVMLQGQFAMVLYLGVLVSWLLVRDGHGEYNDLRGSDHRSVTSYVHKRRVVLLKPDFVE
jgi:hypothetical protein